MGRLQGKTALITGAARGLGAAIARRFTDEGAMVIVNDLSLEAARATAAALGGHGVAGDVADSYTYDRATTTVSVYRDGQLANSEGGITLNTHLIDNSAATNGLPFRVASQNEANGTATGGLRGSMTIARIRVYDEALPATGEDSILAHYQAEVDDFAPQLRLSITYDRGAGTATITWGAAAGASYTVQGSPDLSTWTDRGTAITTGSFTDSQATGNRFYRVRVE